MSVAAPTTFLLDAYRVEDALSLTCLREARVVAGNRGLDRVVEAAGVLDTADIESVAPNQFVLSSAYPLVGSDLDGLVRQLSRARASALGIKLSGYWPEMPEPLARAAEREALPLLLLPEGPFDELLGPLLAAIAERQTNTLRRLAEFHNALTEAALREKGEPGAVIEILTGALGRPAAIFNERGEVVVSSGPPELWTSQELEGRVVRAPEAGSLVVRGERYFLAPVPGGHPHVGAVCVHGVDAADSFAVSAMAHAAVVAGMLLVGRRQVEAIHRRFERELLEDLVDGRLTSPESARSRAAVLGWPLRRPYTVIVAGRLPPGQAEPVRAMGLDLDEADLVAFRRSLADTHREIRLLLRRPGLGIVVHLQQREDARAAADLLMDRLRRDDLPGWVGSELVLGVAEPRREVVDLAGAFREGALALLLGRARPARPGLVYFSDLGPLRLFARVRDRPRLAGTARAMLAPLLPDGLSRHQELFDTLAVLLSRNMSLNATAEEMFFHYNTVRHRLARLHELLGPGLSRPEGRLALSLAVTVLRLVELEERELSVPPGIPPD